MGRSVEELFELALQKEASEFAKIVVDEEPDSICEVLWALSHYYGIENRQQHMKNLVAAVEQLISKGDKDRAQARLPKSLLKMEQKEMTTALKKRGNTRNIKCDSYDLKEEETEGYCKLWAFLLHEMNEQGPQRTVQFIHACIGVYSLYPHRCADLLLTVWECFVECDQQSCALEVIKLLGIEVVELIGFRYLHHHVEQPTAPTWMSNSHIRNMLKNDVPGADLNFFESTPAALHTVAGHLIKDGTLFYSDLLPFLQPSLEVLQKEASTYINNKLTIVDRLSGLNKKGVDKDFYDCKEPNCYKFNTHYGVILGLVHAEAFDLACDLLTTFKDIQPLSYLPLAHGIAHVLSKRVSNLMPKIENAKTDPDVAQTILEEIELIAPLLCHLSYHLSKNLHLFSMLLKCLSCCCGIDTNATQPEPEQDVDDDDEDMNSEPSLSNVQRFQGIVKRLCTYSFLPALSVMTGIERDDKKINNQRESVDAAPPCLQNMLWEILRLLPYRLRFNIYGNVVHLHESRDFELQWAKAKIWDATLKVLRRLTHDNTGELAKKLAKLSQSSPLVFFAAIFRHVMTYGMDIIPAIVDALKSFSPLSLDVMTYKMISYFSDESKKRLKDDKINLDDWLSNLGHFASFFYKRFALKYDVKPMLQFMVWCAKSNKTHELILLSEMLKSAHIDGSVDLSEFQLQALETGPYARVDCGYLYDTGKVDPKQTARLARALRREMREENNANDLILSLAKIHGSCIYEFEKDLEFGSNQGINLRMVKEHHSRIHTVLMQSLTFVNLHIIDKAKTEDLTKILPQTAKQLVEEESVKLPVAITIGRHRVVVANRPLVAANTAGVQAVYGCKPSELVSLIGNSTPISFFTMFWSMDLRDISKPEQVYAKIKVELGKVEKDDKDKLKTTTLLEAEQESQAKTATEITTKIIEEVESLDLTDSELPGDIFQSTFLQRAMLSAEDAIYSSRFLEILSQTKSFPTEKLLGYICEMLPRILCSCTLHEVNRLSFFVTRALKTWESLCLSKQLPKEAFAEGHAVFANHISRLLGRTDHRHEQGLAFEMLRGIQHQFPMHVQVVIKVEEAIQPLLKVCIHCYCKTSKKYT